MDAASGVFDSRVQAEEEEGGADLQCPWQGQTSKAASGRGRDLLPDHRRCSQKTLLCKEPVLAVGTLNPGAGTPRNRSWPLYPRLTCRKMGRGTRGKPSALKAARSRSSPATPVDWMRSRTSQGPQNTAIVTWEGCGGPLTGTGHFCPVSSV